MTLMEMPTRVRRPRDREEVVPTTHFVLYDVSWETYTLLLRQVGQGATRLTYDDGVLEITVNGDEREKFKTLIGRMVEYLAIERDIPISGFGSVTMRKKKLRKGVEPDECYFVQNEPKLREGKRHNLPPDLVVEIDITSGTVPKQPIYAALGVLEVWRFDGVRLRSLHRTKSGKYEAHERSLAFPFLKMADVERFVLQGEKASQTAVMKAWKQWLRKQPA